MGDTLYVTPAQVLAAKLELELSEEDGETPDEALKAIANAQVVARQQSTPGHETSADPTPATVHQQVVKTHIFNRDQDDINSEQAGSPVPPSPTTPPVDAPDDELKLAPSRYVDPTGMSDEKAARLLAEDERREREQGGYRPRTEALAGIDPDDLEDGAVPGPGFGRPEPEPDYGNPDDRDIDEPDRRPDKPSGGFGR
jgi:hypothetical protein